jgi:hypothetical protein
MEAATPNEPIPTETTAATGPTPKRPNGPVAAALLATGIGSLVLAILVIVVEASDSFKASLAYSTRVGELSGKTIWTLVAYLGSWLLLTLILRGQQVDLAKFAIAAGVLVALALIGTFSPFFQLFGSG